MPGWIGRNVLVLALLAAGCLGEGRCAGPVEEPCDGCDGLAGPDAEVWELLDRIVDGSFCPRDELTVLEQREAVGEDLAVLLGPALDEVDFTSRQLVCLQYESCQRARVAGFAWHRQIPGALLALLDAGCLDSCGGLTDTTCRESDRIEVWETPRAPVLACASRPRCR